MKNVYFALAVLFLGFTSCKNSDSTNDDTTAVDTTAVQQETMATTDSLNTTVPDSSATTTDSASAEAGSNVKLPNKISTTEKVIPGEKGKYALAETKWKLVELNGKAVDNSGRDYFINFDSKSGTFRAFVGCNRISGSYFMKATNKVGFTNIITTRMACNDNNAERDFFNNLQKVDNYMIEGEMMHLHVGKKAVAKFEAKR